jgi:hypothetical protein
MGGKALLTSPREFARVSAEKTSKWARVVRAANVPLN